MNPFGKLFVFFISFFSFSFLLVLLFLSSVLTIPLVSAANSSSLKSDVQSLKDASFITKLGPSGNVCLIVQTDILSYSYFTLSKIQDIIITQKRCDEPTFDGVTIKFNSYEAFLRWKNDPKKVTVSGANIDYYLYESNFIENGGILKCTEDFKKRYCDSVTELVGKDKLTLINADCCLSPLEKILPSTSGFSIIYYLLIAVVILVAVLGLLITTKKAKKQETNPELRAYVKTTRMQGYTDEQIKIQLKNAEWKEEEINTALGEK